MDPVRLALGIVMLAGAVAFDLRTRRVPNPYWLPFAVLAGLLLLRDLAGAGTTMTVDRLAAAAVLAGLFYGLFYARMFGGADAKCLMVLAFLWPGSLDLLAGATWPALDALVNASLLMVVVPILYATTNLVRGRIAGLATIVAIPMPIEKARRAHVWPLERVVDGRVRRTLRPAIGRPMDGVYADLRRAGVDVVWATPKVPFMVPLAVGALVAVWHGNLVLRLAVSFTSS